MGHRRQGHRDPQLGAAGRDRPGERENDWARRAAASTDVKTLLYSGTLGLKHNPALLVGLAARRCASRAPVRLVVVNEGPAEAVVREEADALGVPI